MLLYKELPLYANSKIEVNLKTIHLVGYLQLLPPFASL